MLSARTLSLLAVLFLPAVAAMCHAAEAPVIDPALPSLIGEGRARVLVDLRVGDARGDVGQAIAHAQDAVVSRLPQSHATVVRRYASVPLLALEIDATALRALGAMTDVVVRVRPDTTTRPQ